MDRTRFDPLGPLRGALRPPADKSISHRAALIAAMGEGETEIRGYLDAADTRSTLAAIAALGAEVRHGEVGGGATGSQVRRGDVGGDATGGQVRHGEGSGHAVGGQVRHGEGSGDATGTQVRQGDGGGDATVGRVRQGEVASDLLAGRGGRAEASPQAGAAGAGDGLGAESLWIGGVGLRGARSAAIDVGNAGTLLRLLPGWLAGQPEGAWTLDGDESIRRRPVDRVADPLRLMGARLGAREERLPPLEVEAAELHGITYPLPVASAQVKSCLLFAALLAGGETRVVEPLPTRDHSERMLAAAGADIRREGDTIVASPAERLEPGTIVVPADFSSAAFFIVAATIVPGSEVLLREVGLNPTRTGLLTILERMGASGIEVEEKGHQGGEPIGDIRVRHSELHGCEVRGADVPLAIDELPLVALAACFAEGTTRIHEAAELRRKESDRIETVTAALRALGGGVEATEDGMAIAGGGGLEGGAIDSHGDHRIAMLGALAGAASREGVEVANMAAAEVSYPGFEADLASLQHRAPPSDPAH